jgi:peptidyl-prolyl cis-trans isomerase D
MLDAMRRGALNWFAKGLLALLVVAFAIWGVGDVIRRVGTSSVAKIGGTEISIEEFRQAYQDELTSISRRLGRRLTPDQAKLLGLEQRALSRLVGTAAIDAHAHDLHLSLSEQAMADMIRQDPAFHDAQGAFSNRILQAYLRQIGIGSAERYVEIRRKEEVRDQLTETLLSGVAPAPSTIELLHRYREEKRVIEYIAPDFEKLVKVPEPDEARLKEYYEQNKRQFMTPEVRRVNALVLTRTAAKARADIGEAEIKSAYDADTGKYNVPEKRRLQQLKFPNPAAAEKAYAELAKAKNFTEAAAKLGFKDSDIDLGELTKRDMIDPKVADAAFSLKKDELSKPIEGQFGTVLLRAAEITPGKQRPFDEVKAEIKDRLADERARVDIQELHDKVENERSAAKSLKEIADSLKLNFYEIAEIDRSGKTAAGKPALDSPEAAKIAEAAFAGSVGLEPEATDLEDGGYLWADVLAVTPEKQKPYEEVAADVKAAALEQDKRKEIANAAAKLAERLGKGEDLAALAKEAGAKVEKTDAVTRVTSPPGLSQSAVQQAFTLAKGAGAVATGADNKARVILRVADIIAAAPATPEQIERGRNELKRQMQTDVLAEYIGGLQTRYGLKINETALKQALGAQREQPDFE